MNYLKISFKVSKYIWAISILLLLTATLNFGVKEYFLYDNGFLKFV